VTRRRASCDTWYVGIADESPNGSSKYQLNACNACTALGVTTSS